LGSGVDSRDIAIDMIRDIFGANTPVDWKRINYEHRDGKRLKLNVSELTTGLKLSVTQSEMQPGRLGPGVAELRKRLEQLKETMNE